MRLSRRGFLGTTACAIGSGVAGKLLASEFDRSRIDVLLEEPIGEISPDLYGYLLENLGTVIYDGVWVGEQSRIPHIGGIRKELVDRLRDIKASVIRWPGGNFADYYDWKDGIGPRTSRPRRTNFWNDALPPHAPNGPQRYDPNWFGTPEFLRLCRLSGGRPFLNVNTRALSPQAFSQWVEYCNSPPGSTTLADARRADGSEAAYDVRYWGLGNEVWLAGGGMTAEEYAALYKRFASGVPSYGLDLALVACGAPPGPSVEWVRAFLRSCRNTLLPVPIHAISIHYYAAWFLNEMDPGEPLPETDAGWDQRMLDGGKFGIAEWYQTLESTAYLDTLVQTQWQTIGEFDPRHSIKLAVDEWGTIYKRTPTSNPANLTGRPVTLRDALAAALTLDIFHRNCDRIALANFTGLINQEGSLMQADRDQFVTTPAYHVFRMYAGHQGGRSLRTIFDVPRMPQVTKAKMASALSRLSGSASVSGNVLTLTIVNPHVGEPFESEVFIRGGELTSATAAILTDADITAENTFHQPRRVTPTMAEVRTMGSSFRYTFPAASVTAFTLMLKGSGS